MTDREKLLKIASWVDMYDLKTKGNVSDREVQSDLIRIAESLPAPTQDGTAEENIESYWIESDDLGGGMHLMVFKSDYIRAMHRYAAPLRSEIERLKSELAASVSPKLVMPSDTEIIERSFRIWPVAESDYHERIRARYREHFRADWLLCFDLVKELNPSLFK